MHWPPIRSINIVQLFAVNQLAEHCVSAINAPLFAVTSALSVQALTDRSQVSVVAFSLASWISDIFSASQQRSPRLCPGRSSDIWWLDFSKTSPRLLSSKVPKTFVSFCRFALLSCLGCDEICNERRSSKLSKYCPGRSDCLYFLVSRPVTSFWAAMLRLGGAQLAPELTNF